MSDVRRKFNEMGISTCICPDCPCFDMRSVKVSRKRVKAELPPLWSLQRHGVGSKPVVDLSHKLKATHVQRTALVIEMDRQLSIPGKGDIDQMVNQRLKPDVRISWERERKVGGILMEVGLSLNSMSVNFNDPNNLVVGPVVWEVVIEEVKA